MTTQDSSPPARTVAAPAGQLAHATSLTRSGRFAEAGALLLPLSKTHPSDPLVHRALGELLAARRDPRAALSHLQLACPLAPESATNARELDRLQAATGDFDGPRRSFEIGRAHGGTPLTNAPIVCRLVLDQTPTTHTTHIIIIVISKTT